MPARNIESLYELRRQMLARERQDAKSRWLRLALAQCLEATGACSLTHTEFLSIAAEKDARLRAESDTALTAFEDQRKSIDRMADVSNTAPEAIVAVQGARARMRQLGRFFDVHNRVVELRADTQQIIRDASQGMTVAVFEPPSLEMVPVALEIAVDKATELLGDALTLGVLDALKRIRERQSLEPADVRLLKLEKYEDSALIAALGIEMLRRGLLRSMRLPLPEDDPELTVAKRAAAFLPPESPVES